MVKLFNNFTVSAICLSFSANGKYFLMERMRRTNQRARDYVVRHISKDFPTEMSDYVGKLIKKPTVDQ